MVYLKKTLLGRLDIDKDFKDSGIKTESISPVDSFLELLQYLRIVAPLKKNDIPLNKDDRYFMPCVLKSCELTDLREKIPEYDEAKK